MYASAIRLRLECLDAAVVIGHVRGGASVDRIAFGPAINQGRQDIELALVSQALLQPRFITGGWRPKSASRPS
jgi:hypothetical protein